MDPSLNDTIYKPLSLTFVEYRKGNYNLQSFKLVYYLINRTKNLSI
jgi:hypothetical protein